MPLLGSELAQPLPVNSFFNGCLLVIQEQSVDLQAHGCNDDDQVRMQKVLKGYSGYKLIEKGLYNFELQIGLDIHYEVIHCFEENTVEVCEGTNIVTIYHRVETKFLFQDTVDTEIVHRLIPVYREPKLHREVSHKGTSNVKTMIRRGSI